MKLASISFQQEFQQCDRLGIAGLVAGLRETVGLPGGKTQLTRQTSLQHRAAGYKITYKSKSHNLNERQVKNSSPYLLFQGMR